ncbi:LysR family transcriptional regulator [Alloalcanivorax gelatiniphagus]|uniref:LysR family transcriptional regulator n=1 Tax=Alloalcanivorax gelatiniphagus TaxID=1194167 RepID=A0ABY2XJA8_9GAMM|nr:LysR family transcriptional regulator [Alloalcanivorax gelatiniphagus]TMW11987.1 LysR family transcriptional regulator [Alloalcanivorax gelatiniphagus]
MDRFKAMLVFTRVVEAGSFTRAADTLEMPRATVTTAVQQLEAHLGSRLLHRTTRRVSPTLDGGAYYERCLHVLDALAEAEAPLTEQQRPRGRVRVNLPGHPARRLIIPALPLFRERYPDIELEIGISDRPVDLIEERVDCALRVGPLPDSGLVARRVGEVEEINCAAPAYLERHGVPKHPEDLARHQVVRYHAARTGRPLRWEYLDADGAALYLNPPASITVDNTEAYVAAALAGLGLVQVPLYGCHGYLASGELVEVMPEYRPRPSLMSVVYPHNRHLSAKVKVFVEWLIERLRGQPGVHH